MITKNDAAVVLNTELHQWQNHSPTGSPGTRSNTASHGPPHSKCDNNWQKMLNSTNPVTCSQNLLSRVYDTHRDFI